VGAVSGNLLYEYLKNLFIAKGHGIVWAEADEVLSASQVAYRTFFGEVAADEVVASAVFNFGNLVVPFIVLVTCLAGFFIAFKLPKDFTPRILAEEFKAMDPSLDISMFENEPPKKQRSEIIFVQIGLSVLSGFIFGFIWSGILHHSVKSYKKSFPGVVMYLLACFVPYAQIPCMLKMRKEILTVAREKGVQVRIPKLLLILPALVLPVMSVNVVSMAVLQYGLNRIFASEEA
jgi:hypothetical protein